MNYNERNRHDRDSMVVFDPASHGYFVDGMEYRSVTTLVDDCFEKFDAPLWAARKATPSKPAEELLREWDEKGRLAREAGTRMHDRIERYYLGIDDLEDDGDRSFALFLDFAGRHRLTPVRSEWRIFCEEALLAGTLDFLAIAPDGSLELWDWKRSNKVCDPAGRPVTDNRWHKTGFGPVSHIPDTAFNHYALQLSIYRYILETKYDVHPVRAKLGVFHPANPCPWVVEVPYFENEVKSLLRNATAG